MILFQKDLSQKTQGMGEYVYKNNNNFSTALGVKQVNACAFTIISILSCVSLLFLEKLSFSVMVGTLYLFVKYCFKCLIFL